MDKLSVIITGATGMVGEGVLYECLQNDKIEKVLVITRTSCGYVHPKLIEIIHVNFFDITSLSSQLIGYNACYFCLGVTSLGKSEAEYTRLTYTLTLHFATILANLNPKMTFCYISGAGTDSSETGRSMWARVKGRTENDLLKLPFKQVYNFRPGGILPFLPLKPNQTFYKTYKYVGWLLSIMKVIIPNSVIDLKDLALAMIQVSLVAYSKPLLNTKDMIALVKK